MESSQRGALQLVRLIAVCLMVLGLLDGGLYFTQWLAPHHPRAPLNIVRVGLDSVPIILGIVVLIKSKALAEWLADMIQ
jgi:hypothetical protein